MLRNLTRRTSLFSSMWLPLRLWRLRERVSASWEGKLALFLSIAAIIAGFATYAALNSMPPFGGNTDAVIWLLNIDLAILLTLMILVGRRVAGLLAIWRRGIPGAKLHVRFVYIFGLLAMAPAIIMTLFSLFFFHYGVQSWFSDRIRIAVTESREVAEAYLQEHQQVIRADILAMANDIDRSASLIIANPSNFNQFIQTQSFLRNLPEIIIFQRGGENMVRLGLDPNFSQKDIDEFAFDTADKGEVVLLTDTDDDRVRAMVKLRNFTNTYLFVGRKVEANVLNHVSKTREAVQLYDEAATRYAGLRLTVTAIYVVVALVLLLAAMWFGLVFARKLATPISGLIDVADRVRGGDLSARVAENSGLEEFDHLSRSFNRMTSQIMQQRNDLMTVNKLLDQRRHFTETVLSGVSSGIISVDKTGVVTLANNSAASILDTKVPDMIGKKASDILPPLEDILSRAYDRLGKITQAECVYTGNDGTLRNLLVKVAIELIGEIDQGAIVTFDDITDLQSAQRKAAWSDVARRIAHEIKNPLTPIQLSAERLKRKYLASIPEADQAVFSQCIDTIVKHVGDIGHMVNEFSSFARMPEAVIKSHNFNRIVQDIIILNKQAHPNIDVDFTPHSAADQVMCDDQQMRQAVTNIVANALDSVAARLQKQAEPQGKISLDVRPDVTEEDILLLSVTDNGLGLPKDRDPQSLTEPYVTLREKGTGLGLAIVKKIMEDHGGVILFESLEAGARVTLRFPKNLTKV
jgi:two-component system, NtrC family, nitrogen regulation sensor histidine kinase NtrY